MSSSDFEDTDNSRLQFYRWAFSDFCDDDIKGIFAEWMVSKLLNCPSLRRLSWADSDIILPSGISVEVKSSAVWQSYKLYKDGTRLNPLPLPNPVKSTCIRFGGLQARPTGSQWSGERDFKSHLYVFCFQCQIDPAKWDAWDLAQWEFYVMSRLDLIKKKVGRSISLTALRNFRKAMSAAQFQSFMLEKVAWWAMMPAIPCYLCGEAPGTVKHNGWNICSKCETVVKSPGSPAL